MQIIQSIKKPRLYQKTHRIGKYNKLQDTKKLKCIIFIYELITCILWELHLTATQTLLSSSSGSPPLTHAHSIVSAFDTKTYYLPGTPWPYQAGIKVAIHTIPSVLHYDLSILTCSSPPTSIPFTEGSGYKCWVPNKHLLSSILGARTPRELHLQERPGQMYYELEEIRDAWLDYYIQQNYQSQMMKKEKYYMIKPNLSSIYLKSSSTNGTKRKILV